MFATLLLTLAILPVTLLLWSAITLRANLRKARAIGLPIFVRYITPSNPLWMAFGSPIVRLARRLGIATENFHRFYLFGWDANERYRMHTQFGDAFTVVSPGGNWIYVADPNASRDILKHPREFGRNTEQLAVLNVYGKNLSTTEGQEWQKHRKVTAATFTEKNNELVWQSSLSQAQGMLEYWLHRAPKPIRSVADDFKTFTLNVLAAALFSKPYPFEGQEEIKNNSGTADDNDAYQYRTSFAKILHGIILIAIFGGETLRKPWMPKSWRQVGEAVASFRSYVLRLIEEEHANVDKGIDTRKHLVSALVRASVAQKNESEGRDMTSTEQDIISNTFVYGFAGNDTTAITLAHTIVNLSANPATQDWIAEEINHYCTEDDFNKWPYPTWTRLKRCQAVILESLRLCHPLGSSSKLTKAACTLTIAGKSYTIPPQENVQVNFCGLHTNTNFWSDPLTFDPSRFIETSTNPKGDTTNIDSEQLRIFPEGAYIPWSAGERVCPGKRFSQVELGAVLAVLFRKHRVEVVPELVDRRLEGMEEARKRAQVVSMDIQMTLLNEMWKPERVGLRWAEAS